MKYFFLVQELIRKLVEFEKESSSSNIRDFAEWLYWNQKRGEMHSGGHASRSESAEKASRDIGMLYSFAQQYTEKEIKNTSFTSMNEFAFVGRLLEDGPLSKTDLSKKHVMKLTSVIEVLKRLEHKGFILEVQDHKDKRKKLIQLTDQGKKAFFEALPHLQKAADKIPGLLNESELSQLNYLLSKLVNYHERENETR